MLGDDPGVVIEHIALVIEHHAQILCAERGDTAGSPIGDISKIIDKAGDEHEENHAEAAELPEASHVEPLRLCLADDVDEPYHRKPGSRIDARPLARCTYAEEDARERKLTAAAGRDEAVHEQVHQQNEEHSVGVDGGDARLHEVHEVACQHERARGRNGLAAEEPFGEDVDHRQHQHTEESTREAPAERRHAEERNADRDDDLAERGMRYLVRINAVEVLPCGARVVYLVKVCGVHIGLPVGAQ